MAKKQEVAVVKEQNSALVEVPDYLKGNEKLGTETLGKGDFKIPRIKLLQPLSPEVRSFQGKAIPGEFWHGGANISLGSEFLFVPCVVSKRVVLWRPRDDGNGGIMAFSRDGKKWDSGANKEFDVTLKGDVKVKWKTGKDPVSSGLMEFGSSNPKNEQSAPAATLAYEYLVYLIDKPEVGPAVFGVQRTGINNAKALNSHLILTRKPLPCHAIRCFADEEQKGRDVWHVPAFDPAGFVKQEVYKVTSEWADKYSDFVAELEQEDTEVEKVNDEVAY